VHLAQSIPTLPLLVIGTYRDVELDVTRPFAKVLESLLRQRLASRMALRRLPAEAVTALLSAMSGRPAPASLARAIHRETEGNPFFVEEVFQHLSEEGKLFDATGAWHQDLRVESLDVPEGVRLVIGRRLERLSESTRRILTTAAVIGRTFSLTLLESLEETAGDTVLDAVEAAEAAHLLSAQTGARETRYVFAHELIRQTLAETLSLPRRQRLHAKIAAAIERVYAASLDGHISALAHHLYKAGAASDSAKTADVLIRAADQARASAAHEEALAHLDNALSVWEGEPTDLTADVIERRAFALRSLGRPVEAVDAFGRAAAIWTKSGAHDRAAAAITESGQTRQWLMQGEAAAADFVRALRDLSRMSPGARSRLLYAQAQIEGIRGDVNQSLASIAEADELRQQGTDPELDHIALKTKQVNEWYLMHASKSVTLAREVAAVHAARGEVWQEADALWSIPWSLFYLGRLAEATDALADYEAKAQRVGHQGARWLTSFSRAVLASAAGNLDLARQEGLVALEAGRLFQIPWVYQTESFLARLAVWQGRDAEALEILRRIVDLEPERSYWFPTQRCGLFLVLAIFEPAEALAMLRAGQVPLRKPDGPGPAGLWAALCTAVEGLARLGCREDILALAPLVEELRTKELVIAGGWTLPLATVSGIVNRWAERWDDAESDFRRAIGQMDSIPMHHLRGQAREWYADMLRARNGAGDRDHAERLLTEAVGIYTAMGMTGQAKRVRI
jgi:tetratricopeptide (TPR) repeat protein